MLTISSTAVSMSIQRFREILAGEDDTWTVTNQDHSVMFTIKNEETEQRFTGIFGGMFHPNDTVTLSIV